ncbi:hypothetical protein HNY73_011495 [Argiope bruennichi]|uniref:DUF7041 domain-containing protein n=1 Tax=Argiope bruennichi TaxID=94029 RepID=A0A8T0F491_ARGBR|nr:hypothetical protein HNY73_011495 [Argiope bruennichi]
MLILSKGSALLSPGRADRRGKEGHNISVLYEKKICGAIPRVRADYFGVLLTGSIEHIDKNLVGIKTKLGWTLQGKQTKQSKSLENIIYATNLDLTELWSLEAIGIRDPVEIKSRQVADEEIVEFFRKTIKRNEDKRYEVCLPWKRGYPELESNKKIATKSVTKNLIRSGHLSEYDDVFNDWIRKGIIEIVDEDKNKGHYLPPHPWKDFSRREELIILRHCRLVFDASPSSFLLEATTAHHLENFPDVRKETARQLQKSFYVDNCITRLETGEEAVKFISEAKELMSAAKFDLRGWVTSEKIVEETQKRYIPILGLSWDTENDELSCNSAIKISEENITKRTLLSIAQRIYDPIGFKSPTTLIPKIILQKTWKRKFNWDDALPPDICNELLAWYKYVNLLKDCKIPRRLISNPFKDCQISLHCFSDASEVPDGLEVKFNEVYFWTDWTVVLTWIKRIVFGMLAWILRFIKNCRLKEKCKETELTYEEVQSSENYLLKPIQKESFAGRKMKALKNMQTFKDDSNILKVRTKLILGHEEENFKCPILLPGNHEIIRRLIHLKHCELQHAGLRTLISNLRENYWIISVNKIAKRQFITHNGDLDKNLIKKNLRYYRFRFPSMAEISAVRIPTYNFSDPHLWFAMCERTFELGVPKPVTESVMKFNHIVSNLSPEAAAIIRDIIISPDAVDPYTAIKTQLICRYGESSQQEIRKLISGEELGDRKPSELLRTMNRHAASYDFRKNFC